MSGKYLPVGVEGMMGRQPCFSGTHVPVGVLFQNLADGMLLAEIIESWPRSNWSSARRRVRWPVN
jgi:uncharacterized protein (DUF433 family)